MPHRILLADDHAVLRDGLRALLEAAGYQIVGESGHGRETLRLVDQFKPDVVVVDIVMPGLNGVDATRAIVRESPATRVVVLTGHEEEAYVTEALRAGARGYVLKTQAGADLVRAIQEAMRGGLYLSPRVSSSVIDAFRAGTQSPPDPLSL